MEGNRKLRRELGYELAKLSGLQQSVDANDDDAGVKTLALQIREQAEVCLNLLDKYQSSVPSRMWFEAARRCQPLRDDLKRTGIRFRAASGEWQLRTDERPASRAWWRPGESSLPLEALMFGASDAEGETLPADPGDRVDQTAIRPVRPIEVALSDLALDPEPRLLPDDPAQMMTLLTILVGPPHDRGAEIFSANLCTPEWLAAQCESESLVSGDGLLVVRSEDFDEIRIRREVERFLSKIREETWNDVVARIKDWFPCWEFDAYEQ